MSVKRKSNYVVITEEAARNRELSWGARGLHHFLLSFHGNFEITLEQIVKGSNDDNVIVVRRLLAELRRAGLLIEERPSSGDTAYVVLEEA